MEEKKIIISRPKDYSGDIFSALFEQSTVDVIIPLSPKSRGFGETFRQLVTNSKVELIYEGPQAKKRTIHKDDGTEFELEYYDLVFKVQRTNGKPKVVKK